MPSNAATGYSGISVETTAGVAVTTPDHFYPLQEVDFDYSEELIEWQEIRGSRQAKQAQDGAIRPSVTMKGAVYPSGAMGVILRGLFGKVESSKIAPSVTVYRHEFKDAPSLPTLTVERSTGFATEGDPFAQRIAGCKVESFSLAMSYGEQVTFDATLQAMKAPTVVTPATRVSVSYPPEAPLYFAGAAVTVDGVSEGRFKTLNLEVSNTLERQETLNGDRASYAIFEGAMEATLSGTMVFESKQYYDLLVNGTEFDAVVKCDNKVFADQTNSLKFGLELVYPRLRLVRHSIPFSAGATIEADIEFKVLFDDATAKSVGAALINLEDGTDY